MLSAPWRVYLDKKFSDSWDFYRVFMGFSIFYRILEADGIRFMNIWTYGVSMSFLWCILQPSRAHGLTKVDLLAHNIMES